MIDKSNTRNEQNVKTQRDRETAADMDEVRADGDDDDEVGSSEDDHGEDEDGAVTGGWDSLALQTETGVQQVPLACGGSSTCKNSLAWPGWPGSTWLFLPLLRLLRDSSAVWGS